jgi:sugar lactone lactonase YvrE
MRRPLALTAALLLLLALTAAPAQAAGPPLITSTSFSGVGATAATLKGAVDPNGVRTEAHFAYLTQAQYEASGFSEAQRTPEITIPPLVKGEGDLKKGSDRITGFEASAGTFGPGQKIEAPGIPAGTTILAVEADEATGKPQLKISKAANATARVELKATGPQPLEARVEGLSPQSAYRFRVEATNSKAEANPPAPELSFTTLAAPPVYGPCPNDAFRSGALSPLTHPSALLPDCRAYERATPLDKDGGDAQGELAQTKAAAQGGAVTFMSTFGVPGAEGAQSLPTYLASRGQAEWSTKGILPPASTGEKASVVGWSPDMTRIYSKATRLGTPRTSALLVQVEGGAPVQITPFASGPNGSDAEYFYVGSSADNSVVLFESFSALPAAEGEEPIPAAHAGASNLYAWDRESGRLSLAGVKNDGTSPAKGTLGGPYEWTEGITSQSLRIGGSFRGFYTQDERAVSDDGSVFFTEVGTGQLYQRLNPTAAQSALDGQGNCTDPALACTLHVSATEKDNGEGEGGSDGAGAQPAAFMAASADGSEAFFTSPEKLTNDANTGPEQAPAQIERDDLSGPPIETPGFIPGRAIGVAVDADHVYWADPKLGTIGRADLDGDPGSIDPEFIDPGTVECEVEEEPGVFEVIPARPRYVAVDAEHVYWTNTGCSDKFGPLKETGTIGRADIDGDALSVEPAFIPGATNPQGIAVNDEFVYWADTGIGDGNDVARATLAGKEVELHFLHPALSTNPWGIDLSANHIYVSANYQADNRGYIMKFPLEGGDRENLIFGIKVGTRGVAVDGSHVYWATQAAGEEAIGRADLDLGNPESEFIPLSGRPDGLAVDSGHLYWANNGDAPSNPGNDLYRWSVADDGGGNHLSDLTADPSGDGAEVQGVLGASADGSYVYFAANGVLAEGTQQGDCTGPLGAARGQCNLYLWHDGEINLVASLNASGSAVGSDALNWAATPRGQFGTATYIPKTSFASADGRTLLFRSREQLTGYDNEGAPELYRFRVGEGIDCASCPPSGEGAGFWGLGRILFPNLGPSVFAASVSSRNLSADGNRVFFETSEALVAEDTNGADGCPLAGTGVQNYASCTDVYEWEAPGSGSCKAGGPAYSPNNNGCLYLISSGKGEEPSLFADASASGDDVYFFTRDQLVGTDTDSIVDVYDARVGGGLAAQNPVPRPPCEGEACKPAATPPPPYSAPPGFSGPGNPAPKQCKPKKKCCKPKQAKHKGCGKKKHRKHKKQRRRN